MKKKFLSRKIVRQPPMEAWFVFAADVALPRGYADLFLCPYSVPLRLLAGFFRRLFWRYRFFDVSPVAVFFFAGLALALFGAVFGSFHWIQNARRGVATPTGTVILAAVPFILGVQLLLQAVVLDIQNTPRPSQAPRPPDASGGIGASPKAAAHTAVPPSN